MARQTLSASESFPCRSRVMAESGSGPCALARLGSKQLISKSATAVHSAFDLLIDHNTVSALLPNHSGPLIVILSGSEKAVSSLRWIERTCGGLSGQPGSPILWRWRAYRLRKTLGRWSFEGERLPSRAANL